MASKQDWTDIGQRMDNQTATRFYWSLTMMATLGGFLFGYDTANIGSDLNFVPYHLAPWALGYLLAGASLGAAFGAMAAGPLTDRFGRKSFLVINAAVYAAGAILSAFTIDATMLLLARTLVGLAVGADSAIATAYIAEYAPKGRRGTLGILQQWMITIGILVAYIIAIIIFSIWPHQAYSVDWRVILGLGAVPALIGLLFRVRMPESPRWLMEQGRWDRLQSVLSTLGIQVSQSELQQAAQHQPKTEKRSRLTPGVKRALVIAGVFMIFQQITGINVAFYYGPKVLLPYFSSAHMTAVMAAVRGTEATLGLAAVNVAATYIGFRSIDTYGRKGLARLGYGGMAFFMLIAAMVLGLSGMTRAIAILVALAGFITFFAFGVGGTGWIIEGEYFPTEVRGRASSTVAFINWMANFAIVEIFPALMKQIGLGGVMVLFAILAVLATVFVSGWLPETKGLSLEEISSQFEREATR